MFLSCKNNPDAILTNSTSDLTTQDSILHWIKNGKNRDLTSAVRVKNFKKALNNLQFVKKDSLKIHYLSKISLGSIRLDTVLFKKSNKRALKLAVKIGDSTQIAAMYWDMGSFHKRKMSADSSYYYYLQAQHVFEALGKDYNEGRMYYNMALVQSDIQDYMGSQISVAKALELIKPLNKKISLYRCYGLLGTLSNALAEYDQAIVYHNTALKYLDKDKTTSRYYSSALNNLGTVYANQEKFKEAQSYFLEVLSYEDLKDFNPKLYGRAISSLAECKLHIDTNPKEALNLLKKAEKLQDNSEELIGLTFTYRKISEYHLLQKDTTMALQYAKMAQVSGKKSKNFESLFKSLMLEAKLDPKRSSAAIDRYVFLNDSLRLEERSKRNKMALIRFETGEARKKIQIMESQRKLWLGIASGLLLLVGTVSVIILQYFKNQKLRFRQQQQDHNQEIFDSMLAQKGKLVEGKQLEQKRISEELHDGILGQLLGIRLILSSLNNKNTEQAKKQRISVLEKMQEVEEELRIMSHELSDSSYQKMHNFIFSIEEMLIATLGPTKIEYHFIFDDIVNWDMINVNIKINLYRILQETIQNCIKHARATEVFIEMQVVETKLKIYIRDNGCGFDTNKVKKGIGHRNIQSRVKKTKGTWSINSMRNKGTTVTILVPLNLIEIETGPSLKEYA